MKDLLILCFSKDRPLQCDLLISSFFLHCKDRALYINADFNVLYKSSNDEYEKAYHTMLTENEQFVTGISETVFRPYVVSKFNQYKYILFLTDDTIFIQDFVIEDIIKLVDEGVLGFSFRLSENTTYCYPMNQQQEIPKLTDIGTEFRMFDWTKGEYDFHYPLELSSSLYKTKDIWDIVYSFDFKNPNDLESVMYYNMNYFIRKKPLLCCGAKTIAFANPVNRVQNTAPSNRFSGYEDQTADALLERYINGYRVNPHRFVGIQPNACHYEVKL